MMTVGFSIGYTPSNWIQLIEDLLRARDRARDRARARNRDRAYSKIAIFIPGCVPWDMITRDRHRHRHRHRI